MAINSKFIARLQRGQLEDPEGKTLIAKTTADGSELHFVENNLLYKIQNEQKLLVMSKGMQKKKNNNKCT